MPRTDRRDFIKSSIGTAAAAALTARASVGAQTTGPSRPARIRFAAIGINHDHIDSQVESVKRGGGEFVSFYAKEPDLGAAFAKRFPEATRASSEQEILEASNIQLVVSAAIPDERAPLGIEVMRHGKD